jgi:hypothetical protein
MRVMLHCHSTWSYDGAWSLRAIGRLFGMLGVEAVLMTEHDTGFDPESFGRYVAACKDASTRSCRLIPGIEYSSPDNQVHILTWGVPRFLAEHRPVWETLRAVREAGGVAIFAHPARRQAWRVFDPAWVPMLSGIETWNRKTDGFRPSDMALRLSREFDLPATAGVDFHRAKQIFPLWQQITIPEDGDLEPAIIEAIRSRRMRPMLGDTPIDGTDQLRRTALGRISALLHACLSMKRKLKRGQ